MYPWKSVSYVIPGKNFEKRCRLRKTNKRTRCVKNECFSARDILWGRIKHYEKSSLRSHYRFRCALTSVPTPFGFLLLKKKKHRTRVLPYRLQERSAPCLMPHLPMLLLACGSAVEHCLALCTAHGGGHGGLAENTLTPVSACDTGPVVLLLMSSEGNSCADYGSMGEHAEKGAGMPTYHGFDSRGSRNSRSFAFPFHPVTPGKGSALRRSVAICGGVFLHHVHPSWENGKTYYARFYFGG